MSFYKKGKDLRVRFVSPFWNTHECNHSCGLQQTFTNPLTRYRSLDVAVTNPNFRRIFIATCFRTMTIKLEMKYFITPIFRTIIFHCRVSFDNTLFLFYRTRILLVVLSHFVLLIPDLIFPLRTLIDQFYKVPVEDIFFTFKRQPWGHL